MDTFIVDRKIGFPLHLEVEKGIIVNCSNDDNDHYIARMNELYKGKTIQHFQEDFIEKRMKGVWHCIHPLSVMGVLQKLTALDSRKSWLNRVISDNNQRSKHEQALQSLSALTVEISQAEKELKAEMERIKDEHGFEKTYRY